MSILYKLFFAFMVIAFSGSSNAAPITIDGSHVSFSYDDSQMGLALFGAPTVSGDILSFTPLDFSASREGATGTVYTSGFFKVTINSLSLDTTISNLALTELGDYTKEGPTANVIAKGTLTANDLTNGFPQTRFDGPTGTWQTKASAAFNDSISVEAIIHNILGARGRSLDDIANINKTSVLLTAYTVTAVPLPQAVWLFGAGLLGMLKLSKRKNLL
jgi:hypothetical protein